MNSEQRRQVRERILRDCASEPARIWDDAELAEARELEAAGLVSVECGLNLIDLYAEITDAGRREVEKP